MIEQVAYHAARRAALPLESAAVDPTAVHIFWDNSNVFARARATCCDRRGGGLEPGSYLDLRLKFPALMDFAAAGRTVEKAVAVGSVPPELAAVWGRLGHAGLIVDLQERGAASGKEQGVDQALKLEMMNSVIDRAVPAVAVLLTGDGGFKDAVDRMIAKGWGVEVLSFSNGLSFMLKQVTSAPGGRGKYIELDPWYDQLTYLQDINGDTERPSKPLDLSSRRTL